MTAPAWWTARLATTTSPVRGVGACLTSAPVRPSHRPPDPQPPGGRALVSQGTAVSTWASGTHQQHSLVESQVTVHWWVSGLPVPPVDVPTSPSPRQESSLVPSLRSEPSPWPRRRQDWRTSVSIPCGTPRPQSCSPTGCRCWSCEEARSLGHRHHGRRVRPRLPDVARSASDVLAAALAHGR